jgi:hypothetical protein
MQHQLADRGQPLPTESWKDAMVERLPVGAHGRRLISITRPGPGDPADDAGGADVEAEVEFAALGDVDVDSLVGENPPVSCLFPSHSPSRTKTA